MVKTRSKGNQRDRESRSRSNTALSKSKVLKRLAAPSSASSRKLKGKNSENIKKDKDSVRNSSKDTRRTATSASDTVDNSNLRRSKRETPTKRMIQLSPNSNKSKSKSNPSPAKKSNKNERSGGASSSKDPKKVSNLSANEKTNNNKKKKGIVDNQKSESEKDSGTNGLPKKRKLLDARAYRALFKPRAKKSRISENNGSKEKGVDALANDTMEVQSDGDSKKKEKEREKDEKQRDPEESMKESLVASTSGLGETTELKVEESKPQESEATSFSEAKPIEETVAAESVQEIKVDQKEDIKEIEEKEPARFSDHNCDISSPKSMQPPVHIDEKIERAVEEPVLTLPVEASRTEASKDEADCGSYVCVVCKKPGTLLYCDGKECKRSYHISCLDLPLQAVPPGLWFCLFCVQKKIKFGVYSVSEGVESVWDVKDGTNGKQFLVKYKNLAHVYNRWIPESEILSESPDLLSKFNWKNHKDKTTRWKQEWTEPQRLLKRRMLMPEKMAREFFSKLGADALPYCNTEWLVKWRDLSYEHATWELESSPFVCKDEALPLIQDYHTRHELAHKASDPSYSSKALMAKQAPLNKLQKLPVPDGFPSSVDNDHLNSVNQLRDFWHKSHNAIFIDEQERVIKTILFIMSVLPHVSRPLLVVSTVNSLSLWESKFNRLAPAVNLVTYNGNKDVRKLIRDLEFYEEGGSILFQVLLSHPDAIVEDFESVECVCWEAVIVDDCQNVRISKHLVLLKHLCTDFRLLLLSTPLKDNIAEYINLLSYLDNAKKDAGPTNLTSRIDTSNKAGSLVTLKDRLARHVAYERKPDTSKFVEYWVPARLSSVQLELYCSTLISNALALRSFSRIDHVGALRDLLISLRKCCDHPYLVDQSLQSALTKDQPLSEILNVGVNASGKLLLLDKILKEIRNRDLRVLILFQSVGGAGRNPIGDFLDDFVRQKFGPESYEHVERGLLMSKKLAAMNMFNDKSKGRFAFLIENRACLPSVKLSLVDAVIIYDSDWNPLNDLRALQRISIQSDCVPVFRLYSTCSVEEKVLVCTKQDMVLDSNIQGVSTTVSHSLLSWGATSLFARLEKLHAHSDDPGEDKVFLDGVVSELLNKIQSKSRSGSGNLNVRSFLVEARLSGPTSYSRNTGLLAGEKEGFGSLDGDPSAFWSGLLDGRYPQWRYISSDPAQRSRRKVQPFDKWGEKLPSPPVAAEAEDSRRKRKKSADENGMDPGSSVPHGRNSLVAGQQVADFSWEELPSPNGGAARTDSGMRNQGLASGGVRNQIASPADNNVHSTEVDAKSRHAQRTLYLTLKPELSKLCAILGLPENVKSKAEELLVDVMNNRHVDPERQDILQAFVMSLCWRAASLLKHSVNHKESLALAAKHMNYNCREDLSEDILKLMISRNVGSNSPYQSNLSSNNQRLKQEIVTITVEDYNTSTGLAGITLPEPSGEMHTQIGSLNDEEIKKTVDLINDVYSKREQEILLKQKKEISELESYIEREEASLSRAHQSETENISTLGDGNQDKINSMKEEFERKMRVFQEHMQSERNRLQKLQAEVRSSEKNRRDLWVENAKSGKLDEYSDSSPLPDSGFTVEDFCWSRYVEECSRPAASSRSPPLNVGNGREAEGGTIRECEGGNEADKAGGEEIVDNLEETVRAADVAADDAAANPICVINLVQEEPPPVSQVGPTKPPDRETTEAVPQPANNSAVSQADKQADKTNSVVVPPTVTTNAAQSSNPSRQIPNIPLSVGPTVSAGQATTNPVAPTPTIPAPQVTRQPSIDPGSNGVRPELLSNNTGTGTNIGLHQMLPMNLFPLSQGLHPDPLKNELMRIKYHDDILTKKFEEKKTQLRLECEQEIEKTRKKYESLIKNEDMGYQNQKKILGDVYQKVLLNQSLAEEFKAKFIEHRGAPQGGRQQQQVLQSQRIPARPQQIPARPQQIPGRPQQIPGRPQQIRRASSPPTGSSLSVPNSTVTATSRPPIPIPIQIPHATSASLMRPRIPLPHHQLLRPAHGSPPVRLTQFSPVLPPRSGPPAGTEQQRAMAPHLHRFRPPQAAPPPPPPVTAAMESQSSSSAGVTIAAVHPHPGLNASGPNAKTGATVVVTEFPTLDSLLAPYTRAVNDNDDDDNNNSSNNNNNNNNNNNSNNNNNNNNNNNYNIINSNDIVNQTVADLTPQGATVAIGEVVCLSDDE